MDKDEVISALMEQGRGYEEVGKIAEAKAIYERILKRADILSEELVTRLAAIYEKNEPENQEVLYEKAAISALARFDKDSFIKYVTALLGSGDNVSYSIGVSMKDKVEISFASSKGDTISIYGDGAIPEEPAAPVLTEKKDPPKKAKRSKCLPNIDDIAAVLKSGGAEQALYMIDTLKEAEGQIRDLQYLKALCYVATDDMKQAKEAVELELETYPENGKAKRLLVDIKRTLREE